MHVDVTSFQPAAVALIAVHVYVLKPPKPTPHMREFDPRVEQVSSTAPVLHALRPAESARAGHVGGSGVPAVRNAKGSVV